MLHGAQKGSAVPLILPPHFMAIRHCADTCATPAVFPDGMAASVFFGLDGVLYSMPVSDILTFVLSAILIAVTTQRLKSDSPSEMARGGK